MRNDLPSGTVTFLFTDVEGSTKLLHERGAEGYAEALAEHRQIVRDACAAHDGAEVDTQGDAFFFAFPTAPGALAAAREMTEALAAGPIQVRIGLHTGTPLLTEEGYVGDAVHLAARVAATGHGGQVVVSSTAAELVELEFLDLGEHRLKDIDEPVQIFQLGEGAFPPLKTISNTNLPRPASSFVGRETELAEVLSRIEAGARLVTLTGPGGSGKTRLAIEAASSLVPACKAGVFWVGLAALRDPALVIETIGQVLGARDGLAEHISEREMLLLLDNLEQVIEAAPDLSALLIACPNLTLLVTSRELLQIQGEVEYPVPPLAAPEAISLFCERSQLLPSEEIHELCLRLDNLPLAVELAAARTRALSPAQILERLAQRLDLLKGGRDADPRQQTLRATIEWSYELLPPEEQLLFASLSVFAGGCTLEAAEEVAEADLDTLQSLVEKSLIRFSNERYWMLETIREYAGERLEASESRETLRMSCAEHYTVWAEGIAPRLRGATQGEALQFVDAEYENLRTSLAWSLDIEPERALRLGAALRRYWWARSLLHEGQIWLERLLPIARSTTSEAAVSVLIGANALTREQGDWTAATALAEEALRKAEELGEPLQIAGCLHELAIDLYVSGTDTSRAAILWEQSLFLRRELGDLVGVTQVLDGLSGVALEDGDVDRARAYLSEALDLARQLGAKESIAGTLLNLAVLSLDHDGTSADVAWLRGALQESLELAYELGEPLFICASLEALAAPELHLDAPPRAVRLLGAAAGLRETIGAPLDREDQSRYERTVRALRSVMDSGSFDRAWEEGRSAELGDTVALVLRVDDRGSLASRPTTPEEPA